MKFYKKFHFRHGAIATHSIYGQGVGNHLHSRFHLDFRVAQTKQNETLKKMKQAYLEVMHATVPKESEEGDGYITGRAFSHKNHFYLHYVTQLIK